MLLPYFTHFSFKPHPCRLITISCHTGKGKQMVVDGVLKYAVCVDKCFFRAYVPDIFSCLLVFGRYDAALVYSCCHITNRCADTFLFIPFFCLCQQKFIIKIFFLQKKTVDRKFRFACWPFSNTSINECNRPITKPLMANELQALLRACVLFTSISDRKSVKKEIQHV